MKLLKVLLTDLAGVSLIILAGLVGWVPGPGGIPLFLAGLGLLAIHHEWARRLLREVKSHGLKLAEKFFREHRILMAAYDVVASVLVVAGVLILINIQGFLKATSTILIFVGLGLYLGNRRRSQRILRFFRKQP